MERSTQLFHRLLAFGHHFFDRIVINGCLNGLSRPELVASFFLSQVTYWPSGHSFIEQELQREQVGHHKNDNALLVVDDVTALQAAADRPSPQIIHE